MNIELCVQTFQVVVMISTLLLCFTWNEVAADIISQIWVMDCKASAEDGMEAATLQFSQ